MTDRLLLAVLGHPVLHSLSPDLFRSAFAARGQNHLYLRLTADDARRGLELAGELGISGLNVTAPFKESIIPSLDDLDPAAMAIGAVNTCRLRGSGWSGFNTDYLGVTGALETIGVTPTGRRVLVVGAGGAARAAVYAAIQSGAADVAVVNRSAETARRITQRFDVPVYSLDELPTLMTKADIMVSCVPGGFSRLGHVPPAELVILDADYRHEAPGNGFLEPGSNRVNGREWLLAQAIPAFQIMTGEDAPVAAMRSRIENPRSSLKERSRKIALIGFMGCGKSSVGRVLAGRIKRPLVDLDQSIEQTAGMSIADIITRRGEAAFRAMEGAALADIEPAEPQVIACGGGVVTSAVNRKWLQRHCLCVWLWVTPEQAVERSRDDSRPLLQVDDPLVAARRHLAERHGWYAECADLVIAGGQESVDDLAGRIHDEIRFLLTD